MLILFTAEHLHFGIGLVNQIIYERLNGFVRLVDGSSRGGRYVTSTTCPSTLVGYSERYGYNGRGVYLRVCTEESICLSIGTLYKKTYLVKGTPFCETCRCFPRLTANNRTREWRQRPAAEEVPCCCSVEVNDRKDVFVQLLIFSQSNLQFEFITNQHQNRYDTLSL